VQPSWFAAAQFWTTFNGEPGSGDITDNVRTSRSGSQVAGRRAEHAFEAPAKRSTKEDDFRQMWKLQSNVMAHASFGQMKLSLLLTLNASHSAVGSLHLRVSVKGYLDGKTPGPLASKNLNAGHRLTTGPLPNGVKALFPEIAVG
jgi:hypothetical protein